jgi:hypothetical protein
MDDMIQFIDAVTLHGVSNEKKYIKKLEYCLELYKGTKIETLLLKIKEDDHKEMNFLLLTKFVILYSRAL